MTQTSSRSRVKQDTIGQEAMEELYKSFKTASIEDFRDMCLKILESSSASTLTRDKFNSLINEAESKKMMIFTITNFFLAGEGRGV